MAKETFDETCPSCGKFIDDMWEHFKTNSDDETQEIECPHCEVKLCAMRSVSVDYTLRLEDHP